MDSNLGLSSQSHDATDDNKSPNGQRFATLPRRKINDGAPSDWQLRHWFLVSNQPYRHAPGKARVPDEAVWRDVEPFHQANPHIHRQHIDWATAFRSGLPQPLSSQIARRERKPTIINSYFSLLPELMENLRGKAGNGVDAQTKVLSWGVTLGQPRPQRRCVQSICCWWMCGLLDDYDFPARTITEVEPFLATTHCERLPKVLVLQLQYLCRKVTAFSLRYPKGESEVKGESGLCIRKVIQSSIYLCQIARSAGLKFCGCCMSTFWGASPFELTLNCPGFWKLDSNV